MVKVDTDPLFFYSSSVVVSFPLVTDPLLMRGTYDVTNMLKRLNVETSWDIYSWFREYRRRR